MREFFHVGLSLILLMSFSDPVQAQCGGGGSCGGGMQTQMVGSCGGMQTQMVGSCGGMQTQMGGSCDAQSGMMTRAVLTPVMNASDDGSYILPAPVAQFQLAQVRNAPSVIVPIKANNGGVSQNWHSNPVYPVPVMRRGGVVVPDQPAAVVMQPAVLTPVAPVRSPAPVAPARNDAHHDILTRLDAIQRRLDNLPTNSPAALSDDDVNRIADRVKANMDSQFTSLATRQDVASITTSQSQIVSTLEKLITLPAATGNPSTDQRTVLIALQRNEERLSALAAAMDLTKKDIGGVDSRVKDVQVTLQDAAVADQRLQALFAGLSTSNNGTNGKVDAVLTRLKDLSIQMQRSQVVQNTTIKEALQGAQLNFQLELDPGTGQLRSVGAGE